MNHRSWQLLKMHDIEFGGGPSVSQLKDEEALGEFAID
jgi:hypothetical protein